MALLDSRSRTKDSEIPTVISCSYVKARSPTARAKCNVLEDLGLVLHAAQDFYSHSNWVDHGSNASLSLENPCGQIDDNFKKAVEAAIDDSKDKF